MVYIIHMHTQRYSQDLQTSFSKHSLAWKLFFHLGTCLLLSSYYCNLFLTMLFIVCIYYCFVVLVSSSNKGTELTNDWIRNNWPYIFHSKFWKFWSYRASVNNLLKYDTEFQSNPLQLNFVRSSSVLQWLPPINVIQASRNCFSLINWAFKLHSVFASTYLHSETC
jgi:hypothetical protein